MRPAPTTFGARRLLRSSLGFLLLGSGIFGLSACQLSLSEGDPLWREGDELWGWIEKPDARIRVEAFDRCAQRWREVQRSQVREVPENFGGVSGYAWKSHVIPESFDDLGCLVEENGDSIRLRSVEFSDSPRVLGNLPEKGLDCIQERWSAGENLLELWQACRGSDELAVKLRNPCKPGQQLKKKRIEVSFGGNFQRTAQPDPDSGPVFITHFENILFSGRMPIFRGFFVEYRSYLGFELPQLPPQIKGAWLSLFTNFNTGPCDHREDVGCAYSSDDPTEVLGLHILDDTLRYDPRKLAYTALREDDLELAKEIYAQLGEATPVGRVDLDRNDIDRWFEIPISRAGLREIEAQGSEQALVLGLKVATFDPSDFSKRELLFVDHILGLSLNQEISPKLNIVYCE